MSITVILQLNIQPDHLENMQAGMKESTKATRAYDGCQSVTMHQSQDEPCTLVLIQQWDSREHYQKYYDYIVASGAMEQMMPAFASEPILQFLDVVEA